MKILHRQKKKPKANSYQTDYKVSDRDITNTPHHYILVNTPQHLQELEEKLAKAK